ncbi:hypothetical protein L5515_016724 [Caenorhabditis briggsae]|uniref:Protein kinase domain-containing protein n=1 Tax=Caenorhabditis briggsae TaxID=6238 RepID=A0AAE9FF90_CAEBR|nr:hypothetical protein L5515_016724 [Caenorhabditis briggsae]
MAHINDQETINAQEEQNRLLTRYEPGRFVETAGFREAGAFGLTVSAHDSHTKSGVVIKYQKSLFAFKRKLEVFRRMRGDLHFPNLIEYYGKVDPTHGMLYCLAMTNEGVSIHNLTRGTATRWSNGNCVRLLHQLVKAVEALHNMGYCHRDIHPGNILLKRESGGLLTVKLIDFGVAENLYPPPHPAYDWSSWQASLQTCQGMPYTCFDDLTSAVFILFKVINIDPFGARRHWKENKELFDQNPLSWFEEDTMWIAEIYGEIQKQRSHGVDYSGLFRMLGISVPGIPPLSPMEYEMTGNQISIL